MTIRCGPLVMDADTGLVWRHDDEGETEDCGFIGDDHACPPGLEKAWSELLEHWNDSRAYAAACERTAAWSWYDRLSVARLN